MIDWNISRQIVWGIPIPAKICDKCDTGFVDLENKITKCDKCGGAVRKDIDTFDTWFSSGQWPFATLGFPDGKDFKEFYPTDVLETAGDIFHWVARMIMLSIYVTGKLPFTTVYMHGMVLDAKGQKMSKSKGNVINPLDLTEKFGTDAFRMGMVVGNTPGTSLALSEDKIRAYKNFANKIWNITRFVLESTEGVALDEKFEKYTKEDSVLRKARHELLTDVTNDMDSYRFYLAAEKLYHYAWHEFADKIIEDSKKIFSEGDASKIASRKQFLLHTLNKILRALHPFAPFVTEEIWQLSGHKNLLMIEKWPIE